MIFELLIAFQVKHFICDYPLQNAYMLGKFKKGYGWIVPLAAHAFVVSMGTLVIMLIFAPHLWYLAILDFCIHGAVDRMKVLVSPSDIKKPTFWWALGMDQMLHHLTHYFFISVVVTS